MRAKETDSLRRRIAGVKKLIATELERYKGADELEKLVGELDLLEGLARARRRRRSVLWATGAMAAALMAAAILRFSPLDQVDMALAAETRAFVFLNGEETRNILPAGVLLRELTASGEPIARCTDPERLRPFTCKSAKALSLNALFVHAKTTAAVRQLGSCFELVVFAGGARADVSALPPAGEGSAPAAEGSRWQIESTELHPGDSVRFCPVERVILHCSGITSILVGDRIGGAPSEQEDAPALSQAALSILTTGESATFLGTDIPNFGGLTNGVAVASLGDPMKLSLVGRAKSLTVETGSHRRNFMPSRLDWVRGQPALKASLALLAAVFGAVVAVRERWLGEFG